MGRVKSSKARAKRARLEREVKQDIEEIGHGGSSPLQFKFSSSRPETHGKPIYGCQFHPKLEPPIFATVCVNQINIYECCAGDIIRRLATFTFNDDEDEYLYCCAWVPDRLSYPFIAVGGESGKIRIISINEEEHDKGTILGHGDAINHLVFHPSNTDLILSSSKDHTLRLTNYITNCVVAIFAGPGAHKDQVLMADFSTYGYGFQVVSCGMDGVRLWKMINAKTNVAGAGLNSASGTNQARIASASNITQAGSDMVRYNFSEFWDCRGIHTNYVDCVKWVESYIISRDADGNIVIWQTPDPTSPREAGAVIRREMKIPSKDNETIFYIRFSIWKTRLAIGDVSGKVWIFDTDLNKDESHTKNSIQKLSHSKSKSVIRQTTFSPDGNILICVADDGTIWRWDSSE